MTDTAEATEEAAPQQDPPEHKPTWWQRHYTFTGTVLALVFLWLSLTPSLLPRGPLFQGLVSGAAGAIGYGIGVFLVWLVQYMRSKDASPHAPGWAWLAVVVVGVIGQILMIIYFHVWQDEVRDLNGVPRMTFWDHPLTAVLSILVLFIFVEIGQLIGKLIRFLVRQLNRVAPPRISQVVVVVLLLALSIALLNGVVVRVGMDYLNKTFAAANDETDPDFPAPTSKFRSGGPDSLVTWESLGHQGRVFASAGPTVEELTKFNGKPAIEPIRAYAGIHSADGIKATAALAAEELRAKGGLDRDVVAVATTTGTGWINEAEAASLEYMYNGNTAIVSMQYSFLPSWLSFLVDKENARQAGQALFEAVDALITRDARGAAAQAGGFRREPWLLRRRGAVPVAEQRHRPHRRRPVLRADVQQHDLGRPHPQPRRGLAGVAADLRQRRERPLRREAGQSRPSRPIRGVRRAWSTSSTRRIRSHGGTPTFFSQNRTGCGSPAATTCPGECSGFRW